MSIISSQNPLTHTDIICFYRISSFAKKLWDKKLKIMWYFFVNLFNNRLIKPKMINNRLIKLNMINNQMIKLVLRTGQVISGDPIRLTWNIQVGSSNPWPEPGRVKASTWPGWPVILKIKKCHSGVFFTFIYEKCRSVAF